jgi:rhamnose utilization protein RhaD (predicted bifunctional aldolase and dehydrogenase)
MAEAVENSAGRPSVEAPLHNVFSATYVVHTHPALVNGMTCAKEGREVCAQLFPDALWVEYIDPGYTLCMEVRKRIQAYTVEHGREPALLVLKNHGIFVAADTADEIRELYARVMDSLVAAYAEIGVNTELLVPDAAATPDDATEVIQDLLGDDAAAIVSSGPFAFSPGPISPDHLVYAKAFPFADELTAERMADYKAERGYAPRVVVMRDRIYGVGTSQKNAELALEFSQDGAQVMQLAAAFGGIDYMTDRAREFIENWEVESYRAKQVG